MTPKEREDYEIILTHTEEIRRDILKDKRLNTSTWFHNGISLLAGVCTGLLIVYENIYIKIACAVFLGFITAYLNTEVKAYKKMLSQNLIGQSDELIKKLKNELGKKN